MSIKFCCDFCGKPLPEIGLYDEIPCIKFYRTKELNTTMIFPNLCENCATKLDEALKYARGEWIKQLNISSRNAEINKYRRDKLGTKG